MWVWAILTNASIIGICLPFNHILAFILKKCLTAYNYVIEYWSNLKMLLLWTSFCSGPRYIRQCWWLCGPAQAFCHLTKTVPRLLRRCSIPLWHEHHLIIDFQNLHSTGPLWDTFNWALVCGACQCFCPPQIHWLQIVIVVTRMLL